MAEITAAQVHDLLTLTHEYLAAGDAAVKARDSLGLVFLEVARQAKVGLRELSAVSGLHHATIKAMLQRAAGDGLPDGWEQLELPIPVVPAAAAPSPTAAPRPTHRIQPTPPSPPMSRQSPAISL